MTDEERKVFEALLRLTGYCEGHGRTCEGCMFLQEGEDGCPIGCPSWDDIPVVLVNRFFKGS